MKNSDDILTTDTTEIKQLINRVKQGELDQGDAQLIEKLLNFLLTMVSLLQRKHTSIRQMKELLFGMKEKKRGKAALRLEQSAKLVGRHIQVAFPFFGRMPRGFQYHCLRDTRQDAARHKSVAKIVKV
jgi:hypothetical protein